MLPLMLHLLWRVLWRPSLDNWEEESSVVLWEKVWCPSRPGRIGTETTMHTHNTASNIIITATAYDDNIATTHSVKGG